MHETFVRPSMQGCIRGWRFSAGRQDSVSELEALVDSYSIVVAWKWKPLLSFTYSHRLTSHQTAITPSNEQHSSS